jgi:hypothetical protein
MMTTTTANESEQALLVEVMTDVPFVVPENTIVVADEGHNSDAFA